MNEIKSIEALKEMLHEFEKQVTQSIAAELKWINRTVSMSQLDYTPFTEEVKDYMDAIGLDKEGLVILDTLFNDLDEKYLSDCISDNEISSWGLIELLEQLKKITT